MARVTFLFVMIFLAIQGFAQGKSEYSDFNIPTKDGQAFYEIIDSAGCKGKDKSTIYLAGRKAFADLFKSLHGVIQMDDSGGGAIVGKGRYVIHHKINWGLKETTWIKFTVSFQCKDGKFRLQFYDFSTKGREYHKFTPLAEKREETEENRIRFFSVFHSQTQLLLEGFKNTIMKNLDADF